MPESIESIRARYKRRDEAIFHAYLNQGQSPKYTVVGRMFGISAQRTRQLILRGFFRMADEKGWHYTIDCIKREVSGLSTQYMQKDFIEYYPYWKARHVS